MSLTDRSVLLAAATLAFWTMFVLLVTALARAFAGLRCGVRLDDFKHGESSAVPAWAAVVNRNYMNLLELPTLFYVAAMMILLGSFTS